VLVYLEPSKIYNGPKIVRSAPVYEYIVLINPALSRYFRASLQLHNTPVDCARELFKPSKDSASLLVCNEKKLSFGFSYFVGDVISGVGLGFFG